MLFIISQGNGDAWDFLFEFSLCLYIHTPQNKTFPGISRIMMFIWGKLY
jgi:hypothetical protein